MSTAAARVLEDPTDTQLRDLLAELDFRDPQLLVERQGASLAGQTLQIRMDHKLDPDDGRGYIVEYRGGGPNMHFRATVRDSSSRWRATASPAADLVAKTLRDWAFEREGWHGTMMWERIRA
ncbi:MAG: hypothetical protein J2P18_00345 [Nocardia sp.]|nr:hypothetical protein [Nocardia sp.]